MQFFKHLLAVLSFSYAALAVELSPLVGGNDGLLTNDVYNVAVDGRSSSKFTMQYLTSSLSQVPCC